MKENNTNKVLAWTVCPYLVVHTLVLSVLAIITWLAPNFEYFFKFIPFISVSEKTLNALNNIKFLLFQQTIIAACSAGLGGSVFMIKRFFIEYVEGVEYENSVKNVPLSTKDIPRFILLPISAIVIGPVSLCLLKAGAIIAFGGFSHKGQIPMFTIVAVSFIIGLAYFDTLHAFCEMTKRFFWKKSHGKKQTEG